MSAHSISVGDSTSSSSSSKSESATKFATGEDQERCDICGDLSLCENCDSAQCGNCCRQCNYCWCTDTKKCKLCSSYAKEAEVDAPPAPASQPSIPCAVPASFSSATSLKEGKKKKKVASRMPTRGSEARTRNALKTERVNQMKRKREENIARGIKPRGIPKNQSQHGITKTHKRRKT